jgi:hypothetical protein
MNYGFKNYIRVFYKEEWLGSSSKENKKEEKGLLDKWVNLVKGVSQIAWDAKIAYDAWDAIERSKKSTNPNVIKVVKILTATGAISDNKTSLLTRWWEGSGKSWALKIIESLEKAEKWEIHVVVYSNNNYESFPLETYESKVCNDVTFMNIGLMKWMYSLRWSGIWFQDTTWNQIWLYVFNRGWASNLVSWWNQSDINTVIELWKKEKETKEAKLKAVLESSLKDPKMKEFLKEKQILINDKFDIKNELDKLKAEKKSIAEVETHFNWLADKFLKEAKLLLEESKNIAKQTGLDKKTLAQLKIPGIKSTTDGKTIDISDRLLTELNQKECQDAMIGIDTWFNNLDKKSPDYKEKQELALNIKKVLIKRIGGFKEADKAAKAKKTADKAQKDWKNGITTEKFETDNEKTLDAAGNIWVARFQQESTKKGLQDFWIYTLVQAEDKLQIIQDKYPLTQEEEYLKKLLEQFIRDNIAVARELQITENILWRDQARELFTQTNRFISKDPAEEYNFDHLEQIAIQTDPESTSGGRRFARLEPGDSISVEEFIERRSWNEIEYSTPELSNSHIIKNTDWTYSILWSLKISNHLTRKELREYIETIRLYSKIWLWQFIPHIPMIAQELRKRGINVALDWVTNTMEQQKILKPLYKMLFGKEIISTNLSEIERAFSSALGNPSNIRDTMQRVLKTHKLITESNMQIMPNVFQTWMQENRKENSPSSINM